MDFKLSKEHEMARKMFREFAENELEPLAVEIDEEERFPWESVEKFARYGMMGIPIPKKYGGAGGDNLMYCIAIEEISKKCATSSVIVAAHTSLCMGPIMAFGTEEQKMKWIPDLASGRKIGAFGLTEPGAGTDASGQQTMAVKDGDEYVLNGTKCFITNGDTASTYVVFAVTDKTKGLKGISLFVVEKGTPGFSTGLHEKKMGIRGSSTTDLIFEDCRIPAGNLIGKEGQGWKICMHTLNGARAGVAAQALGIGEGALDLAMKYVQERMQFKKKLSKFQRTQCEIADMHTKLEAGKLLVYSAACKEDAYNKGDKTQNYAMDSAMAKLFCGEAASDVTRRCVQLFGGYGYIREYQVERMMRDAKITEIYEGTSEAQRMVISGHLGIK